MRYGLTASNMQSKALFAMLANTKLCYNRLRQKRLSSMWAVENPGWPLWVFYNKLPNLSSIFLN